MLIAYLIGFVITLCWIIYFSFGEGDFIVKDFLFFIFFSLFWPLTIFWLLMFVFGDVVLWRKK